MFALNSVKLLQLLPTLTLLGLALTGIEDMPSAMAHRTVPRSPREHHRHIANRQQAAAGVEAQEKKRETTPGSMIRRGANGSACRVRGTTTSPVSSSTSATAASSSTTTDAAPTVTATSPTADTAAVTSTSSSAIADDGGLIAQGGSVSSTTTKTASSAASTASSAAPVSKSPTTSSGGMTNSASKLGAAWPNGDWASKTDPNYIGNYIGSKTSWYYTWSPVNVGSADSLGLEFVPMLWGPNQVSSFQSQQSSWPSSVKNALFFNEPNEGSQSNMAASDSVSYWMNNMVPLRAKGISLGGAATTSAPDGLQWILDFQKACVADGNSAADCKMDYVPIHWYDTTPSNFQTYVENFHAKTGLDIWVTEYACQNFNGGAQCSSSDVTDLHHSMAAWFDEQDYIKRYAPFGMMENMQGVNQDNALMNPSGSITDLGSWYISSA